jgi:hypothetical protein
VKWVKFNEIEFTEGVNFSRTDLKTGKDFFSYCQLYLLGGLSSIIYVLQLVIDASLTGRFHLDLIVSLPLKLLTF